MIDNSPPSPDLIPYADGAESLCKPSEPIAQLLHAVNSMPDPLAALADPADPFAIDLLWSQREIQSMDVIEFIDVPVCDVLVPARNRQIPLRIYGGRISPLPWTPASRPAGALPVLLFVHGGGWTLNSIGTYDSVTRYLAKELPAVVVSVDYRLAPEHPFPAGFLDVRFILQWLGWHAGRFGGDPGSIIVAGDSGGANLATAAALDLQFETAPPPPAPIAQVLFYPSTDLTTTRRPSYEQFGTGHLLTTQAVEMFTRFYVPCEDRRRDIRVSPLGATVDQLRRLPPSLLVMAGCDVLRDEGKAYADKLRSAGVPVQALLAPGMIHGFLLFYNKRMYSSFPGVSESVQRILDQTAAHIRPLVGSSATDH